MRQLLKKVFSPHIRDSIKQKLLAIDLLILPMFSRTPFLASVYYCFFNRNFSREHQATLLGRIKFYGLKNQQPNHLVLLRRNIHRLEKGLIMQPRKAIFAQAYIHETVTGFSSYLGEAQVEQATVQWANDVLSEYFKVVTLTEGILSAKAIYDLAASNMRPDDHLALKAVPYERKCSISSSVTYEQLLELCLQRRSVRWYLDKDVPKDLIYKAVDLATQAPSACNRQPFEFYLFNTKEQAQKIGGLAMGTAGFSHNFNCIMVVVGDLAAYPYERDRHVIYIDGSLAAMQLALALETLGLGSCMINWPDVEHLESKMANELNLKANQRPIMLISIGYPDPNGGIPFSAKKPSTVLIKDMTQ